MTASHPHLQFVDSYLRKARDGQKPRFVRILAYKSILTGMDVIAKAYPGEVPEEEYMGIYRTVKKEWRELHGLRTPS